ncbi:LOW QUALITY PROTEIN: carbonic anhydrase 2 [Drosophila eugracilis]|uniref:LOW QUALITY PROTEIN: carbonic anhydrase 2 n=1 Tax=Drosophila eugracilis TaxID=29029 RepID=UPI001BDADAAF|nr:LOW QUALITY PROTEIN: carbonic anhydrase 2 [Drosophila eugracilis]
MSGCQSSGLSNLFWCYLDDLSCRLQDSNLLKLILAFIVALLVLFHVYTAFALANSCDERLGDAEERSDDGDGAGEDYMGGSSSDLTCRIRVSPESYNYGWDRGPHTWDTPCNNQSPINIERNSLEINYFDTPLIWSHYNDMPLGIRLENNGHTLILRAAFPGRTPSIDGGDLLGRFDFREISFRWSWTSSSGSEHTFDHMHSPLEMQCLHTDADGDGCSSSQGILMISYMFDFSNDNPFLNVLIQHLVAVQEAGQVVEVPPFPLSYLMPAFYDKFYSYKGSLTEPPCHRGAEWFLHPAPLGISERQLNEFRQLRDRRGARIASNARPVQPLDDRTVYLNRYQS